MIFVFSFFLLFVFPFVVNAHLYVENVFIQIHIFQFNLFMKKIILLPSELATFLKICLLRTEQISVQEQVLRAQALHTKNSGEFL